MTARTFFGRIVPERIKVDMPYLEVGVSRASGEPVTKMGILIADSQIVVTADQPLDSDPSTERNIVGNVVALWTDLLAWRHGVGVTVDIVGAAGATLAESRIFPKQIPVIASIQRVPPADDIRVIDEMLTSDMDGVLRPLRRALSDFRQAILQPDDTPFHCYRAVESLTYYFDRNPRRGTRKLCESLRIDPQWLRKALEVKSGEIRHGKVRAVSDVERQDAFRSASAVIERFIILVYRKVEMLPAEFSLLD